MSPAPTQRCADAATKYVTRPRGWRKAARLAAHIATCPACLPAFIAALRKAAR